MPEARPLADWLRDAAALLAAASDTPRLDAELLAAHALGLARGDMLLHLRAGAVPPAVDALLARRLAGEPLAYITGLRDFWTLQLRVTPDVLIPRPDTETLLAAAVRHFAGTKGPRDILDLGTGSGALLLAALSEWPDATGLGIDRSAAALDVARDNAARCGFAARAMFQNGNWAQGLARRFDLVLCNPPYVAQGDPLAAEVARREPHGALFAGPDGLDAYRQLAPGLGGCLADGGVAVFEIGFDQGQSAAALFRDAGWTVDVLQDLGGRDRCLMIQRANAGV